MGVEELLGIEVPERAKYVRVICSELNRCIYIMYWLAIYGIFLGHSTMFMWPAGDRELLIDLMEKISGARVTHAHFVQVELEMICHQTLKKYIYVKSVTLKNVSKNMLQSFMTIQF